MIFTAASAALTFALAGCGESGSSGTSAPPTAATGGCAGVAGDSLVVLTDDKKLQNADNIVALINTKGSSPALVAAVDKVAAALDTTKLIALNKAVDIDRKTPQVAAAEFATAAGFATGLSGGSGAVKIGAANFSESQTLAELYKIALTAAGFKATVQTAGNRELYEAALERGELTVFPEYAATITEFLNQKANGKTAAPKASGDIDATITALKELGGKVGLTVGTPSAAADQNAFAVTKAFAEKNGVKTLSDFAAKCSGKASILAGPAECPQRPFCQLGLKDKYGIEFGSFQQADAGGPQTKTALTTGAAALGLVFSSDGGLATL
ncbi:osmoprotectant transport system substrate-binding protein [Allocatelliglobosispora scoriae]|uniref:Osmoprotectant transport system substrate-binding protein n=1 Tax=Allocatelliglobosispora scoriae TaxID=643052 RepID=A0A841BXT8_9ACTN|nr:osmoprotectant transport system substrate-binding protein [Allocatelliglobosispora scoriae]